MSLLAALGLRMLGIGQYLWGLVKAALAWLFRHPLQAIILVLAVLSLWLFNENLNIRKQVEAQTERADQLRTALNNTVDAYRIAAATALADAELHKTTNEAAQREITSNAQSTLTARLRSELASVRAQSGAARANSCGPSQAGLPRTDTAASDPDGTGRQALLDAEACTAAVVKAEGWQDWYSSIRAQFSAPTAAQPTNSNGDPK